MKNKDDATLLLYAAVVLAVGSVGSVFMAIATGMGWIT